MTTATIPHIQIDDQGIARIAGSRIKVMHLVIEKMANGWGPEQLQEQFPHLSLAKIHAAFAYYYDHKEEIDAAIAEDVRLGEAAWRAAAESVLAKRLRAKGKLAGASGCTSMNTWNRPSQLRSGRGGLTF